jgi:DNA-binding NtrC family response regulator
MPRSSPAEPADREFFALAAQAAFRNPFADDYDDLLQKLTGRKARGDLTSAAGEIVRRRVEQLDAAGLAELQAWRPDLRAEMRLVFLFDVYRRFDTDFDAHIAAQIAAGDTPVRVDFAGEALALLQRRGIPAAEALRLFAMFFQIRRAAHFIQHGLIGRSACMRELRRHLWENLFTHDIRWYEQHLWDRMEDFSVLLLGETGTGKGTAAAAIGRSGFIPFDETRGTFVESFARGFVMLNLSQFPEALLESELFGHRKGAFTGAIDAHEGVFARCSPHGAIFLDEIGEVREPVQIKLLQVLQDRIFSPVGSRERLRFRGRVVAATNRSLQNLRERGVFRDDFYYRLCSDTITVPPLRERLREDPRELDDLLDSLLARLTGQPSPDLAAEIRAILLAGVGRDYAWPGNVRELEQAVRRILLTRRYQGDVVRGGAEPRAAFLAAIEAGTLDADTLLAGYCGLLHERMGNYEEVARRTGLDRRTVRKYVTLKRPPPAPPLG